MEDELGQGVCTAETSCTAPPEKTPSYTPTKSSGSSHADMSQQFGRMGVFTTSPGMTDLERNVAQTQSNIQKTSEQQLEGLAETATWSSQRSDVQAQIAAAEAQVVAIRSSPTGSQWITSSGDTISREQAITEMSRDVSEAKRMFGIMDVEYEKAEEYRKEYGDILIMGATNPKKIMEKYKGSKFLDISIPAWLSEEEYKASKTGYVDKPFDYTQLPLTPAAAITQWTKHGVGSFVRKVEAMERSGTFNVQSIANEVSQRRTGLNYEEGMKTLNPLQQLGMKAEITVLSFGGGVLRTGAAVAKDPVGSAIQGLNPLNIQENIVSLGKQFKVDPAGVAGGVSAILAGGKAFEKIFPVRKEVLVKTPALKYATPKIKGVVDAPEVMWGVAYALKTRGVKPGEAATESFRLSGTAEKPTLRLRDRLAPPDTTVKVEEGGFEMETLSGFRQASVILGKRTDIIPRSTVPKDFMIEDAPVNVYVPIGNLQKMLGRKPTVERFFKSKRGETEIVKTEMSAAKISKTRTQYQPEDILYPDYMQPYMKMAVAIKRMQQRMTEITPKGNTIKFMKAVEKDMKPLETVDVVVEGQRSVPLPKELIMIAKAKAPAAESFLKKPADLRPEYSELSWQKFVESFRTPEQSPMIAQRKFLLELERMGGTKMLQKIRMMEEPKPVILPTKLTGQAAHTSLQITPQDFMSFRTVTNPVLIDMIDEDMEELNYPRKSLVSLVEKPTIKDIGWAGLRSDFMVNMKEVPSVAESVRNRIGILYGLAARSGTDTVTTPKMMPRLAERTAQVQTQQMKQMERTDVKLDRFTGLRDKLIPVRMRTRMPSSKFSAPKFSMPKVSGFDVYVKKMGKLVRVSERPLVKEEAMRLGGYITETTPAATFLLRASGSPSISSKKFSYAFRPERFYRKGKLFIEKSKYRINQPGEVMGISMKGWEAARKKLKRKPKRWFI
jgi:hypothetical protein